MWVSCIWDSLSIKWCASDIIPFSQPWNLLIKMLSQMRNYNYNSDSKYKNYNSCLLKSNTPPPPPPFCFPLQIIACIIGSQHHVMVFTLENWNTKTWTVVTWWQCNDSEMKYQLLCPQKWFKPSSGCWDLLQAEDCGQDLRGICLLCEVCLNM